MPGRWSQCTVSMCIVLRRHQRSCWYPFLRRQATHFAYVLHWAVEQKHSVNREDCSCPACLIHQADHGHCWTKGQYVKCHSVLLWCPKMVAAAEPGSSIADLAPFVSQTPLQRCRQRRVTKPHHCSWRPRSRLLDVVLMNGNFAPVVLQRRPKPKDGGLPIIGNGVRVLTKR